MNICYILAMQKEAEPFITHYDVKKIEGAFAPLPCQLYQKQITDEDTLSVVVNGQQHGSSLVGCEAATLTTLKAIELLKPDLVVNSGTCGAFKENGADIGDVYIANAVMFHDRRVYGDDEWGTQTLGNYPLWKMSDNVASALGLKLGKVTTGSSLDMQPCDLTVIKENDGELKEMEAAAVAFVCSLFHTPCMIVKSVTDLLDTSEETLEVFHKNLAFASEQLCKANVKIIDYITSNVKKG